MLQRKHSAILLTFIKLPFVIKIFVMSIFEWPFYTGFTVIEKKSTEDKKACKSIKSHIWLFETEFAAKIYWYKNVI